MGRGGRKNNKKCDIEAPEHIAENLGDNTDFDDLKAPEPTVENLGSHADFNDFTGTDNALIDINSIHKRAIKAFGSRCYSSGVSIAYSELIESGSTDNKAHQLALKAFGSCHYLNGVNRAYSALIESDSADNDAHKFAIKAFGNCRDADGVNRAYNALIENDSADNDTHKLAIIAFGHCRDSDGVNRTYSALIKNDPADNEVYKLAITAFANCHDLDGVNRAYSALLESDSADNQNHKLAMKAFGDCNCLKDVSRAYDAIVKSGTADNEAYKLAIKVFGNCRDSDGVNKAYNALIESDSADNDAHKLAIKAFGNCCNLEGVNSAYSALLESDSTDDEAHIFAKRAFKRCNYSKGITIARNAPNIGNKKNIMSLEDKKEIIGGENSIKKDKCSAGYTYPLNKNKGFITAEASECMGRAEQIWGNMDSNPINEFCSAFTKFHEIWMLSEANLSRYYQTALPEEKSIIANCLIRMALLPLQVFCTFSKEQPRVDKLSIRPEWLMETSINWIAVINDLEKFFYQSGNKYSQTCAPAPAYFYLIHSTRHKAWRTMQHLLPVNSQVNIKKIQKTISKLGNEATLQLIWLNAYRCYYHDSKHKLYDASQLDINAKLRASYIETAQQWAIYEKTCKELLTHFEADRNQHIYHHAISAADEKAGSAVNEEKAHITLTPNNTQVSTLLCTFFAKPSDTDSKVTMQSVRKRAYSCPPSSRCNVPR